MAEEICLESALTRLTHGETARTEPVSTTGSPGFIIDGLAAVVKKVCLSDSWVDLLLLAIPVQMEPSLS